MPVLREKKIIFVHVPKTGGSSIEKVLGLHPNDVKDCNYFLSGTNYHLQHLTLQEIEKILIEDGEVISEYSVIGMVREPIDRMLSEFRWRKKINHKIVKDLDVNEFIDSIYNRLSSGEYIDSHFTEQSKYFELSQNSHFSSIDILKYEDGFDVVAELLKKVIPNREFTIPKVNHTNHIDINRAHLSAQSIDKIMTLYKNDFEQFYKELA